MKCNTFWYLTVSPAVRVGIKAGNSYKRWHCSASFPMISTPTHCERASHIETKDRLSHFWLESPLKCMHLIVLRQTAHIKSDFLLWMNDSFEVLQKRQKHKLWNITSCSLVEDACVSSTLFVVFKNPKVYSMFSSII